VAVMEMAENREETEEKDTPEAQGAPDQAEASLDEILAKKAEGDGPEETEDDSMLALGREERVETLSVKVVPQQPTEFVCKSCFLVKHRSQLADKKRMFCRDCA
jgi:Domain of unknown function (DUF4193)